MSFFIAIALAGAGTGALGAGTGPAVVSQVEGAATLNGSAGSSIPARPLHTVAGDTTLRLESRAEATVVCPDDRALRLRGPVEWRPSDGCTPGQALPGGTWARLVPADGRVRDFEGSLLEESPSRNDDGAGLVPDLLAPRSPARGTVTIGTPAPEIVWAEVRDGIDYRLVLEREDQSAPAVQTVSAARAVCAADPRAAPARACSLAWPWPPLRDDEVVTLRVEADVRDPDRPVRIADACRLRLAPADERQRVIAARDAVPAALDDATAALLRAAVFAEAGWFNEAAEALAATVAENPSATAALRLGNLYLGLGLPRAAQTFVLRAQSALPRDGDDDTRAEVLRALGRIQLRRENPSSAIQLLERAAKLFSRLGRTADAEATVAEADAARPAAP